MANLKSGDLVTGIHSTLLLYVEDIKGNTAKLLYFSHVLKRWVHHGDYPLTALRKASSDVLELYRK